MLCGNMLYARTLALTCIFLHSCLFINLLPFVNLCFSLLNMVMSLLFCYQVRERRLLELEFTFCASMIDLILP